MKILLSIMACALVCAVSVSARDLDITAARVEKYVIRKKSNIPCDTVVFYMFKNDHAVLQLNITSDPDQIEVYQDVKFSVTGKMRLFKEEVTTRTMESWIRNQHLVEQHPNMPKPVTVKLPADACQVFEGKTKKAANLVSGFPNGKSYLDHDIKIQVSELKVEGFRLHSFVLETSSYVLFKPTK